MLKIKPRVSTGLLDLQLIYICVLTSRYGAQSVIEFEAASDKDRSEKLFQDQVAGVRKVS